MQMLPTKALAAGKVPFMGARAQSLSCQRRPSALDATLNPNCASLAPDQILKSRCWKVLPAGYSPYCRSLGKLPVMQSLVCVTIWLRRCYEQVLKDPVMCSGP